MLVRITPGVKFLAATVPKLIGPPVLVHVALRNFGATYLPSYYTSRILIACIWLFALPIWLCLRAKYTHFIRVHEARRMGAELAPMVKGAKLFYIPRDRSYNN